MAYGFLRPDTFDTELDAVSFVVERMMEQLNTMKLVQVVAVHGGGAAQAAGTVDVLPLVSQVDGNGYGTKHGTIYGIPWTRVQGGKSAVIIDPVVGDVGYVIASDRDISVVKSTNGKAGLPGSGRTFAIEDGVYAGACLNPAAPNQYLWANPQGGWTLRDSLGNSIVTSSTGVVITDKNNNTVTMNGSGMNLTDKNANQMQMKAGAINMVCTVFQVNGVTVTVP